MLFIKKGVCGFIALTLLNPAKTITGFNAAKVLVLKCMAIQMKTIEQYFPVA